MRVNAAAILELAIVLGALFIGVVGAIAALRARTQAFGDRLALRLALARETALLESARALAEASRTSVDAVRAALDRAIGAIAPAVDFFLVFEERDETFVCVYARGARALYFDRAAIALDDPRIAAVLAQHHHAVLERPSRSAALHPADVACAFFPIARDAGTRVLAYASSSTAPLTNVFPTIAALVDQAGPAYRIALERRADKQRAEYDGLTGLLTPRAFRARLATLFDRARTDARARIALLFVDTDHFKAWNDTFGHESGDLVLRQIAELLKGCVRSDADLVARNGGDEFCVVLADAEKAQAIEAAVALAAAIAAADRSSLQPGGSPASVRITASIGVATFPTDAVTVAEVLEAADAAMYHAKKTGRDGVSFYDAGQLLARADREEIFQKSG